MMSKFVIDHETEKRLHTMFSYKRSRAGVVLPSVTEFAEEDAPIAGPTTPRFQSSTSLHQENAPARKTIPSRIYQQRPPPLVWNH